jgi:hypothetical protein
LIQQDERVGPAGREPDMAQASARRLGRRSTRPLSTAEAALVATLAYLLLLIGLTGARLDRASAADAGTAAGAVPVADSRPAAAIHGLAECVGPNTTSYSYASAPGVVEPLAFGPPVQPPGGFTRSAVNGVLIERLCYRPDRRLYAAIDAVVNGRDPNRPLTRAEWSAGVTSFVTKDARFVDAQVVSRTVRARTPTFGVRARPGADPLVLRTRLKRTDTGRYLLLPVRSASGRVVTLMLRLRCGFQPVL